MDWPRAIERNSEALSGILAALFAMLGLAEGVKLGRIAKPLHRAVLRILWPAESALRRLIVIAARGLKVKLPPKRPAAKGSFGKASGKRPPAFQLFDSRKRFAHQRRPRRTGPGPRVWVAGPDPHLSPLWARPGPAAPAAPPSDGLVDATRLSRRLQAFKLALDDLPRQAKRLARWRQRRQQAASPKFTSPLRPGRPPGHRKKPLHEVDHVLTECHGLAFDALALDTS